MGSSYSELSRLDDNDVMLAQTERDLFGSSRLFSPRRQAIRPAVHLDSINWLSAVRPEMVISCSSDKTIALNNMDTGACLTRWRGHEREVTKVVYKHVGCRHFVLSGSKDKMVRLWHFDSPECCQVFFGHQMAVTGLAALDEAKFVSGGRDGKMALWDSERDQPVRTVGSSQNLVTHIEPDPEAKVIYQTAEDGCLRLWDAQNLAPIDQLSTGQNYAQWHCSLSPNESHSCLTAGGGRMGDGCEVGLWDLRQRKLIQQFRGHDSDVRAAIFLHQQQVTWKRLVLSCSSDRTARLWDLNTGRCVWTENVPAELNTCVGFSDGSVVVAGARATLCELRLLVKAGKPFLHCSSVQSVLEDK